MVTKPKSALDAESVRKDFPIFRRTVRGKPLIYLDSAATSQKPQCVIDAERAFYERYNANVHRGAYLIAEEATAAYETAREKVAKFINAPGKECIVFTRGTTEAINLVAYAWGWANLRDGDEILLTGMEHHSNIVPWQLIAERTGAKIKVVPVTDDGVLDMDAFERLITEQVKIVAVTHVSNVLGTINPVQEICRKAHEVGAVVLVDGAQAAPHLPVDVQAIGCDFYALSGHKMCGPTGSGVLYGRKELLEAMPPFLGGGEMIRTVTFERTTFNDVPYKFEAGTPPIAQAIGLGAAVDYLTHIGMERVRAHEIELTAYALERLQEVDGITIYGAAPPEQRGGVIAFNIGDIHPHDLATFLDAHGICIRAGHHCAQPLMRRLNVAATARASFYLYNTPDEVDALESALRKAVRFFAR
ncbi:Cysteine desulfurase SufS [bacterium HR17]|uniref:Cysteine desulfurase n=1 Tax=Candidatus Fervidibacter japonicus TaxID=2035412 RepID=A0A2H5XAT3_9BACT|nr:Cysteine desulfurase SufS [bacterium HR17]